MSKWIGPKRKLLVINLSNPEKTKYRNPKTIGSWLWGRRLDNYKLFRVYGKSFEKLPMLISDVIYIQKMVDAFFK